MRLRIFCRLVQTIVTCCLFFLYVVKSMKSSQMLKLRY